MSSETEPLKDAKTDQAFVLRQIKVITRTLGILTVGVLWLSCVLIIRDQSDSYVGYYLIAAAGITTFFEITWILDKSFCCARDGCCCKVWSAILWVDTWVKLLLYCGLAIPLFLENNRIVLGIVSGLLLIILGVFYLIKTFRGQKTVTVHKTVYRVKRPGTLVLHEISTQTDQDLLEMVSIETTIPTIPGTSEASAGSSAVGYTAPGSPDVPEDGGASQSSKKSKKK